jgi:acetyl coenzyme A synthetase (ADP forming)-like protein
MLALHTEDVVLRDGSTLRLRPPTADDEGALISFFASMSPESRYLRFHGATVIGRQTVSVALETDWASRGSLVGELADDAGHLTAVALATYVRLRDPKRAEVAFAVADELHGRGIGTRLLERLAEHAAEVGVEEFVAEVLPGNAAMLRVFDDAGFETARALQGGVVEVVLHLDHTRPAVVERRDERDHVAVAASLKPFFEPQSVAVMGASPRRGTIGGELFRNILAADYTGAAYPINRSGDAVGGVPGYRDITDVPVVVDLVVICVPGEHVLEAARSALGTGVKAVCVISAGFAETGAEGKQRQDELLALVRAHGARLIGPNCLGIATNATRLNATFARRSAPAGRIGFSSQSGALGLALLEEADARGLGLSSFVSIGNKADVSSNDLLEYWQDDPNTDVVLLYLESFGNPRKFARVASRVARTKPILAMRSGTSRAGARAASSHTAALAGSDAAVEALFWQAGVLRARTLEELLDAAVLFSTQPLPRGNRVAVLTNAGGLGILCADACEAGGLSLPGLADATVEALERVVPAEASSANPVDLLGSATADTYEVALPIVLADPGVDAVIVLFVPPVVATTADVSAAIARASVGADKPVLPVVISADGSPAGSFTYPESAARALGLAARRAAWLRRPAAQAPHLDRIDHGAVADLIHRLGRLAEDFPEVAELDLNPVIARPDGCIAVDARVRLSRPAAATTSKTW